MCVVLVNCNCCWSTAAAVYHPSSTSGGSLVFQLAASHGALLPLLTPLNIAAAVAVTTVRTREVSLMIHSARPTVSPVVNIVLAWSLFCFVLLDLEKWGRTYGRTTCAQTMITTRRDCGSAEWINNKARTGRIRTRRNMSSVHPSNGGSKKQPAAAAAPSVGHGRGLRAQMSFQHGSTTHQHPPSPQQLHPLSGSPNMLRRKLGGKLKLEGEEGSCTTVAVGEDTYTIGRSLSWLFFYPPGPAWIGRLAEICS